MEFSVNKNNQIKKRIISLALTILTLSVLLSFPISATSLSKLIRGNEVYVGGMPFGIKLYTEGLLVVGFSPVDCDSGSATPASDAGILVGDVITEVNGIKVTSSAEFADAVGKTTNAMTLKYLRHGEEHTTSVTPSLSRKDGRYKTGMWLRDSTAGIGTVTFTVPETREFAGLGHGVCDAETGDVIPLLRGVAAEARISGIKKGEAGCPGELRGYFTGSEIGTVSKNTSCGVFGSFKSDMINPSLPSKVPIGGKTDIQLGEADIYCTLEGATPQKYRISITKLPKESSNFEIEVCDSTLLDMTGGIVQGMSGSPIIQNGKLVGAVTHVLISDPTKGYGIYIEDMIEAAE